MTAYPVQIFDVSANRLIDGELHDEIGEKQLIDWENEWMPALDAYIARLVDKGISGQDPDWPQSGHWNWRNKMSAVKDLLGSVGYSITCCGVTQGMMSLDIISKRGRLPEQTGEHLIYVDYLEVAPWNWKGLYADPSKYKLIGYALMHAAFKRSIDEGFKGRIGLHSLPQAIPFYERCGLTNLGTSPDDEHSGKLPYFEATTAVAEAYLKGKPQ